MEYIKTDYIIKLEEDLKKNKYITNIDSFISEYPLPNKDETLNFCKYLYNVFNNMKTTGKGLSKKDTYSKFIPKMNEYVEESFIGKEYREINKILSQIIKLDLSISTKELVKTVKGTFKNAEPATQNIEIKNIKSKERNRNDYTKVFLELIFKLFIIVLYALLTYGISQIGNSITRAILLILAVAFFPFFLIKLFDYNLK